MWSLLGFSEESPPEESQDATAANPPTPSHQDVPASPSATEGKEVAGVASSASPETKADAPSDSPPATPTSGGGFWSFWGASTPAEAEPAATTPVSSTAAAVETPDSGISETPGPSGVSSSAAESGGDEKQKKKKKKESGKGGEAVAEKKKKKKESEKGGEMVAEKKKGESEEMSSKLVSGSDVEAFRARLEQIELQKKAKEEAKVKRKEDEKKQKEEKREQRGREREEREKKKQEKEAARIAELKRLEEELKRTQELAEELEKQNEERKNKRKGDRGESSSRGSSSSPSSGRSRREASEERRKAREEREKRRREEQAGLEELLEATERELTETARSLQESIDRQREEREELERRRQAQVKREMEIRQLAEEATRALEAQQQAARAAAAPAPPGASKGQPPAPSLVSPADVKARNFMVALLKRDGGPSLPPPELEQRRLAEPARGETSGAKAEDRQAPELSRKGAAAPTAGRVLAETEVTEGDESMLRPFLAKRGDSVGDEYQEAQYTQQHVIFRGPAFRAFHELVNATKEINHLKEQVEAASRDEEEITTLRERLQTLLDKETKNSESHLERACAIRQALNSISIVFRAAQRRLKTLFFTKLNAAAGAAMPRAVGTSAALRAILGGDSKVTRLGFGLLREVVLRHLRQAWNQWTRYVKPRDAPPGRGAGTGIGTLEDEKATAAIIALREVEDEAEALKKYNEEEKRKLAEVASRLERWRRQLVAAHDAVIHLRENETKRCKSGVREKERGDRRRPRTSSTLDSAEDDAQAPDVLTRLNALVHTEMHRLGLRFENPRAGFGGDSTPHLETRNRDPFRRIPRSFQTENIGHLRLLHGDANGSFPEDRLSSFLESRTSDNGSVRSARGRGVRRRRSLHENGNKALSGTESDTSSVSESISSGRSSSTSSEGSGALSSSEKRRASSRMSGENPSRRNNTVDEGGRRKKNFDKACEDAEITHDLAPATRGQPSKSGDQASSQVSVVKGTLPASRIVKTRPKPPPPPGASEPATFGGGQQRKLQPASGTETSQDDLESAPSTRSSCSGKGPKGTGAPTGSTVIYADAHHTQASAKAKNAVQAKVKMERDRQRTATIVVGAGPPILAPKSLVNGPKSGPKPKQ
ncbi:hypothetical protein TGP89_257370 [Toxoplasma gondii p89]|uniref:Uncharacterized protein n=1 Tax=Toxoplasma gondii p89 TaxID=943119 RepID=A0A086L159_TOXGO|nr:hypothetical protein TGP89_257370 [Toxoplasma gondii p89]